MIASLSNRSGYDSSDLRRLIDRGLRANGIRKAIHVIVVASPIRSRGCATIGGSRLVLAIASPSNFSMRRFARVLDHEAMHLQGLEHGDMNERDLYSLGPVPRWAKGARLRYRGRAPKQLGRRAACDMRGVRGRDR